MWHPCCLTEISQGDALNYLKVCSAVIVLTVAYPVGMDKSVSVQPLLEYSDEEFNTPGCLCPLSEEECKLNVLNVFFFSCFILFYIFYIFYQKSALTLI